MVDDHKYLATVDTDEETGDVTLHVLSQECTAELHKGAEFIEELLYERGTS